MKYLIYGLKDVRTGDVRYVGKSTSGIKRPKEHFKPSALLKSSHKSNWMKSAIAAGFLPEIVILEICESADDLYQREKQWVLNLRSQGANLTNLTDGGDGTHGYKHSATTIERLSQLRTGKPSPTKGLPSKQRGIPKGKPTDSHIENMRIAQARISKNADVMAGRLATLESAREKTMRPIVDSNGVRYASIADAAKSLGLHKPNIIAVLQGRYKASGGLSFKYAEL